MEPNYIWLPSTIGKHYGVKSNTICPDKYQKKMLGQQTHTHTASAGFLNEGVMEFLS